MSCKAEADNPIFQLRLGHYKGQSVKAALIAAGKDRDIAATGIIKNMLIPWLVKNGYLNDGAGQ